jgi:hypothetical protein
VKRLYFRRFYTFKQSSEAVGGLQAEHALE